VGGGIVNLIDDEPDAVCAQSGRDTEALGDLMLIDTFRQQSLYPPYIGLVQLGTAIGSADIAGPGHACGVGDGEGRLELWSTFP
jgi:hypothetical protein